jgi:hypothetical protein
MKFEVNLRVKLFWGPLSIMILKEEAMQTINVFLIFLKTTDALIIEMKYWLCLIELILIKMV